MDIHEPAFVLGSGYLRERASAIESEIKAKFTVYDDFVTGNLKYELRLILNILHARGEL